MSWKTILKKEPTLGRLPSFKGRDIDDVIPNLWKKIKSKMSDAQQTIIRRKSAIKNQIKENKQRMKHAPKKRVAKLKQDLEKLSKDENTTMRQEIKLIERINYTNETINQLKDSEDAFGHIEAFFKSILRSKRWWELDE